MLHGTFYYGVGVDPFKQKEMISKKSFGHSFNVSSYKEKWVATFYSFPFVNDKCNSGTFLIEKEIGFDREVQMF